MGIVIPDAINVFSVNGLGYVVPDAINVFPVNGLGYVVQGAINMFEANWPGHVVPNVKYVFKVPAGTPGAENVFFIGCFPATELVLMDSDNYAPIGSIKIGDKIRSWDMGRRRMQYTAVRDIHRYKVNEIICFNGSMRVSSSHPLMVMVEAECGLLIPEWRVAFDVSVGDDAVGPNGKIVKIISKNTQWYDDSIDVLNLSTEGGVPFLVGNCVVRAENAQDNIRWANTPLTQKLIA